MLRIVLRPSLHPPIRKIQAPFIQSVSESFNDRVQSVKTFNCSSVIKISIVVGCNRVHAGSHPLNMNIAPSLPIDCLITCRVDYMRIRHTTARLIGAECREHLRTSFGPTQSSFDSMNT